VTRIETGTLAALLGVIAATTVQIGDGTLVAFITLVVAPLAGVAWREREKRLSSQAKCDRLSEKLAEFEAETPELQAEVVALRAEVNDLLRQTSWSGGMTERYPSPSSRSTRRPTSWRSPGQSRDLPHGSGASSESTTDTPT
jgi:hypothetical protein